ncbi:heparan-alpha-glucosaminide N-acetyltransferase domain-containing protein [Pseudonocardia yuanmonensis]|uniref:Heparan-alpha-glucosaminide N-acetyltransferase domain-containing protein n=1 Tax=Pseudonocardia yuanmonensis TaxID=1095914 RepID=A0ABP8X7Q0_9PSEU
MTATAPLPRTDPPPSAPEASSSRLLGMDAARGVAVLGMMAVHSLYDTAPDGAPTATYLVTAGRSAAVFAVLAGVGIAFTTGRRRVRWGAEGRSAATSLAARAAVVGAIGLALGWGSAEIAANILPYYALMFLLAIPLVFLPTRALVAVAALLAAGMPVLSQWVRPGLPAPSLENPTVAQLVTDPLGLLSELALTGYYPALPWLAYLAVGIAVGRLRLADTRVAVWLAAAGAALAAVATLVARWVMGPLGGHAAIAAVTPPELLASAPTVPDFVAVSPEGTTPTTTWWWLGTDAPHSGTPLDLAQTIGSALAVLGVMLLVGRLANPLVQAVLRPLAAIGALTLTVYTLHLVFLNSPLDTFDALEGYLVQVVVVALGALAWRRAVGRGPLESLVRVAARAAGRAVA